MLEYSADRRLTINSQPVDVQELQTRLSDLFRERRDKTLYISADGGLRYGEVVTLIDAAKGAGVARVGVITESMRAQPGERSVNVEKGRPRFRGRPFLSEIRRNRD